jgi:hypothetical protein
MKFRTRKSKLEHKIKEEFSRQTPRAERIVEILEEFESDNLKTIEKLKKKKKATLKKVNGALKQSINAHGPITKDLLGSASKRVYGSILESEQEDSKISIRHVLLGIGIGLILSFLMSFL